MLVVVSAFRVREFGAIVLGCACMLIKRAVNQLSVRRTSGVRNEREMQRGQQLREHREEARNACCEDS